MTFTKFSKYLQIGHSKARRNMKHTELFHLTVIFLQGNVVFRTFQGFIVFFFSFPYEIILRYSAWKDMKNKYNTAYNSGLYKSTTYVFTCVNIYIRYREY